MFLSGHAGVRALFAAHSPREGGQTDLRKGAKVIDGAGGMKTQREREEEKEKETCHAPVAQLLGFLVNIFQDQMFDRLFSKLPATPPECFHHFNAPEYAFLLPSLSCRQLRELQQAHEQFVKEGGEITQTAVSLH